ncbi:MAG: N-acetylmuramoyl-L-alanine amidase [Candidatus Sericytochromatia bacterium]|nr:N-acetylmuramoyl-L-alanine amidase [Candidatus Sericytochromatia bacterium]
MHRSRNLGLPSLSSGAARWGRLGDGLSLLTAALLCALFPARPASAEGLAVVYPPNGHVTTAERIFLIGTAAPGDVVWLNGQRVHRSPGGHFAPSLPLAVGSNLVTLAHRGQTLQMTVVRKPQEVPLASGPHFAEGSLEPAQDRAVQPGEAVRFAAVAPPGALVSVHIGGRTVPLVPQPPASRLPDNKAGLTGQNAPVAVTRVTYAGVARFGTPGRLGKPIFQVSLGAERAQTLGSGSLEVMAPERQPVIEVSAEAGITRSGPSSDFSRGTPLPRGTRALVTGRDGQFLRLAHGAWIDQQETVTLPGAVPPASVVRSLRWRTRAGQTEVLIPLQQALPFQIEVGERELNLQLHHAQAQTDIIRTDEDPLIRRLDWSQVGPDRIRYRFALKTPLPWGYQTRYEGTTLVLAMRHAPPLPAHQRRLEGLRIVLDAGHGGSGDRGTHGPTGVPEKDVTLPMTRRLRSELEARGATVVMTRDGDEEVGLKARTDIIASSTPHLALSLHYNALPDAGDAENTRGFGAFWYHPQAHGLAQAIHRRVTQDLGRPSYGVWWDNLALARPSAAPSVLLEMGFLINPEEYEWCVDAHEQRRLAEAIADGVGDWLLRPRE